MHWSSSWSIPSSQKTCAAIDQEILCNFALYANTTDLQNDQKFAPNNDITGKSIVRVFYITTIISLALSILLMYDKYKVHFSDKRRSDSDKRSEHRYYVKLVHTIESLLHSLSDQQLIAGIALLLSINHQACRISAYHYNLVCTMLLMSIITHLNSLINIPDFLYKGKIVASYRLIGICAQFVLSGMVLSARNINAFPSQPSSLAIMPAACFENMNASKDLGFSDFVGFAQNVTAGPTLNTTANVTEIWDNIGAATSSVSGLGEYATLVVFVLFAVIILAFDFAEAVAFCSSRIMRGISIFFSAASIFASIVIVAFALYRYNGLRRGMEVEQWYRGADDDDLTLSQLLTILLAGSGLFAFLKAVTDSLEGVPGLRYEKHALKGA